MNFGHEPILVIITTLLDEGREPVTACVGVILHTIAHTHLIAEEVPTYIQRTVEPRALYR